MAGAPTTRPDGTRSAGARNLARRLWPEAEVSGNVVSGTDAFFEAINHPAGDLAQFWTNATAAEWRRQGDMWAGLPPLIATELDRMIQQPDRNGLLARCILVTNLRFYHGAAPDWARARLLRLLDWSVDEAEHVATMWRTFLGHGQYDDSLLRAGLLDFFLDTIGHGVEIDNERTMTDLGRHLATIAVRSDDPPTAWLPRLTTTASPAVRLTWIRFVGRQLRDMAADEADAQWHRWIENHWTDRVASVPRPFTYDEASAIAGWVLGLPSVRSEAIGLVQQVPAGLERDDRVLITLAKMDLHPEASLWARYLVHLLEGMPADEPWAICRHLSQIVPKLREGASDETYRNLVDHGLRMGCESAPDW